MQTQDSLVSEPAVQPERLVLHVGPGIPNPLKLHASFRQPGWREIRLDISADNEPDIVGDMTDMHAVASGSMDAVYSSHNLEHVYPHEVAIVLAEFRRVLKPGGHVLLTCPDLVATARAILDKGLTGAAYQSPSGPITPLDILYGFGKAIARGNHYMAHKTGFSVDSLHAAFQQAGFVQIDCRAGNSFDLWIRAFKPRVVRTPATVSPE
ncbi:MAG: class I SAM-dependent methyltransferase [Brevundimonas sp.]|uniref:class I SAM-dependent methyltransferase n=1 Tax=Brevundimonas sp. TaxID=1871086 RepID=UPI0027329544|nr:class I SAM-dependent methyltransferase [Brevundimonas sp.]MDP3405086.1 class I SAM-dependent methyltransferase [Brevundimonas sp.]